LPDRDGLAQAIELIDNAVKFSPNGGCIQASAQAQAAPSYRLLIRAGYSAG
jgi:signal transduction histidine kinase